MKIAVIEGFLEGPLHSRRLKQALIQHGHEITTPEAADCIIVHSGGWVFLPPLTDNQRLILLDPAYKSRRSFALRTLNRVIHDFRHLRWSMLLERTWNAYYFFSYFKRWIALHRFLHQKSITPLLKRHNTFVIGVEGSSWWEEDFLKSSGTRYTVVSGDHDIIWTQPELALDARGIEI